MGEATVFYTESAPERVTAALLLETDPIGTVKRRLRTREGLSLTDCVTDRPYASSSMLAVAIGRVFSTALNGRSDSHPESAASALPLEIAVPAVPVRATPRPLLSGTELVRLAEALSRLYLLLPVLDDATSTLRGLPLAGGRPPARRSTMTRRTPAGPDNAPRVATRALVTSVYQNHSRSRRPQPRPRLSSDA